MNIFIHWIYELIHSHILPPLPPLPHTQTPLCGLLSLEWSWNVNTRSNLLDTRFYTHYFLGGGGIVPRPRQHFMSNSQWKRNLSSTLRSPNRCTPVLVKYTCECIVSKININKGIKELVYVCTKTLITIRNFYSVGMSKVQKSCCIQILIRVNAILNRIYTRAFLAFLNPHIKNPCMVYGPKWHKKHTYHQRHMSSWYLQYIYPKHHQSNTNFNSQGFKVCVCMCVIRCHS